MLREDWILVAIALSPSHSLQPLQLQTALCLFGQKFSPTQLHCDDFYQFQKHEFGTFSLPIHTDAEEMVAKELLEISTELWPAREYLTTPRAQEAVESAIAGLSSDVVVYARQAVEWITSFTVYELARKDLSDYPALATDDSHRPCR